MSNRRHSDLLAGDKLEKDQARKGTDMEEDEAETEMLLKGEKEAEAEEGSAESQAEAVRPAVGEEKPDSEQCAEISP